jgi:hypothetical protein
MEKKVAFLTIFATMVLLYGFLIFRILPAVITVIFILALWLIVDGVIPQAAILAGNVRRLGEDTAEIRKLLVANNSGALPD